MRNLNRKDYAVLVMAIAMAMPVVLAFNGNPETWYINVVGIVYAVWMVRTLIVSRIGRLFFERLLKIESKLFATA